MRKINSSVTENLLFEPFVELTLIDIFFSTFDNKYTSLNFINFARLNGANMFRFVNKVLTVGVILLSDIFVSMRL